MNWIKWFFQLFKQERERQTEIEYDVERENINQASSSRLKMDHGRDVEAKVAYQYPKGKFRFPLIPDEEPVREKRTSPPLNKEWKQREFAPVERMSERKADEPAEAEHVQTKTKTEKIIRSSRPFKPTEVPSPIYGFKRPENRVQHRSVEYELSPFTGETSTKHVQVEQSIAIKKEESAAAAQSVPAQAAAETPTAAMEEISPREAVRTERTMFEERSSATIAEVSPSETVKEEPSVIEAPPAALEEVSPLEEVKEEPLVIETPPAAALEEVSLSEEAKEEPSVIETPPAAALKEVSPSETAKEEQEKFEESLATVGAGSLTEKEKGASIEQRFALNETVVKHDEPSQEAAVINEKSAPAVQNIAASSERNTVKEKTVPHLPFNVIMLKQDKRKLEQKRMLEQKQVSPVPPKQEIASDKVLPLKETEQRESYPFPPLSLLVPPHVVEESDEWINGQRDLLNNTLKNFNVGAEVVNVTQGPSVTRFEVQPEPGVKVNKITNLSDDIKLSLAARDIRIEAPIPGKHTIGIEVPNQKSRPVFLSEIVNSREFMENKSPLTAALGLDISGKPIVTDLQKMPHGLIAGATGSGKSVCINTILVSLLYKAKPEELKLLLIDPKMVELAPYNQIPHLVSPVITDVKAATASLKWAVEEMERRYELFAHTGVRDISRFNELAVEHKRYADKLPYIVIVIDELADLMMMSPADVEEAISRIAQKARACGIHLIIATQRPSVDVITGLIKANIPTRIAFSVSSQVDSRTIIDMSGAEKLLGKGDMLFLENGSSKPFRLQGTFVSDEEIDEVVAYVRKQGEPNYLFEQEELLRKTQIIDEEDELFYEACEFVIEHGGASTSSLQRRFKIGYNRAARLIDLMEQQGFISESKGSKPRDVLITEEELETLQESNILS